MAYIFGNDKEKVDFAAAIQEILDPLEENYQANINTMYDAFVAQGVTPADKTPAGLANAVASVRTKGRSDKNSFTIEFKRGSLIMDNGGTLQLYNLQILVNGIDILSFAGGSNWTLAVNKPSGASTSKTGYASYTYKVSTS